MSLSQHLWWKLVWGGIRVGCFFKGRQRDSKAGRSSVLCRTEGQPYRIWTRIAEQLPWHQLGSALAHKVAPGWLSHSHTLTWCGVPHPYHLSAALWQKQTDPQRNRNISSCSCPEGNEVWKPLCIVHVVDVLLSSYQKPQVTKGRSDMCQHQIEAWLVSELIFSLTHNFNRNQACKWCLNNPEESHLCICWRETMGQNLYKFKRSKYHQPWT